MALVDKSCQAARFKRALGQKSEKLLRLSTQTKAVTMGKLGCKCTERVRNYAGVAKA